MSLYLKSRDSVQQQRKRMKSRDPVLEQLEREREIGSIVSKRVLIRQTRTKTVMFSRDMWGRKRDGITRNLWGMESRELWGMEPREIIFMLGYVRHSQAVLRLPCSFHFPKLRKWPFIYWTRESFSYFAADLIRQCFLLVWKKLPNFNNMFCLFL